MTTSTTAARVDSPTDRAVTQAFLSDTVSSRDGTTIGYRRIGEGPGIVVLHGAMESGGSHTELARALAHGFSVYLPDRRGRGRSGPFGDGYGIRKEIEDLDALLRRTGSERVFGVSSGAVIALEAALALPSIRKAAIFDPPLMPASAVPTALLARYDREIADGRVAAALITGMKAARLAPPMLDLMPRWLLERFTQSMLDREDRTAGADDVTVRKLAPTMHYDFQIIAEAAGSASRFSAIAGQVLLLGGAKSPAYLRAAVDELAKALPRAQRVTLAGLDHSAAGNPSDPMTGRGAQPDRVADVLRRFFA